MPSRSKPLSKYIVIFLFKAHLWEKSLLAIKEGNDVAN